MTSSTVQLDSCGTRTAYHRFEEWGLGGGKYACTWFGPLSHDDTLKYAVLRIDTQSDCGSNCWGFYIDGVLKDYHSLCCGQAQVVVASGEFNNFGSGVATGRNVGALWGGDDTTDWQKDDTVDGTDWVTIRSGDNLNTDGLWYVGALPTPFVANHP